MANSGTIPLSVTSAGNAITGWIAWAESDVDTAANTSRVTARLIYRNTGVVTTYSDQSTFYLTVNGSTVRKTDGGTVAAGGGTLEALDHTVTVAHNADGSKSITISAGGALVGTVGLSASSGSGTAALTGIPRATQPGVPSGADIGTSITISLPRSSSSFTHTLHYRLDGGGWTSIASGAGASCTWTIPMDLCSRITGAASAAVTVRAQTYNGSTLIGEKTAALTVRVPAGVKPAASMTVDIVNDNATLAQWGVAVKGYSKLGYAVTGDAADDYGATISAYQFQAGGETLTARTGTTGVLTEAGELTAKGAVQDSRGRWSDAATGTVTVYDYAVPAITGAYARRCAADGTPSDDGAYLTVLCGGTCSDVGGRNSVTVRLRWHRTGEAWGGYVTLPNGTETVVDAGLLADASYEAELSVTDALGTGRTVVCSIPTAAVAFHLRRGGKAAAFGKYAEHERELELAEDWDLRYHGATMADHVVEQGASDGWRWRKWHSGAAELWCRRELNGLAVTAAMGQVYASDGQTEWYPFDVFDAVCTAAAGYGGTAVHFPWVGGVVPWQKKAEYRLMCATSVTLPSVTVSLTVHGRWK